MAANKGTPSVEAAAVVRIGPDDEDGLEVPPVWGGVMQRVTGNLGSAAKADSPEQCAGVLRGLRDGERG